MKSTLIAALLAGALGLAPAAMAADPKTDCAAAEKKAAECKKAGATGADCKKAADLMAGECKPKKKEKKGGC